jgi:hypothetical protein
MAGNNDFVPFATGVGANIYTVAAYKALTARQTGVVAGEADPQMANNSWRQASVIAAMIGQFIADQGFNATDDGDIATLEANFKNALAYASAQIHYGRDTSTTAGSLTVPTLSPGFASLIEGMLFEIVPNTTAIGGQTITLGTQSAITLLREDGNPTLAGDTVANQPFLGIYLGGALRILGPVASEVAAWTKTTLASQQITGGRTVTYSTAGTYTWTVPAGVNSIRVLDCIGGGGGGGGASGTNAGGSAGGGGGNAKDGVYTVTPSEVLTIVVGAGGTPGFGGVSPTNGGSGGTTYIQRANGTVLCSASGGGGGSAGNNALQTTSRGVGGAAVGGGRNFSGSGGGFPIAISASLVLGGIGGPAGAAASQPQLNASNAGLDGFPRGGGANGSSASAAGGTGGAGEFSFSY